MLQVGPLESEFLPGVRVGVSHLKETPTPGPISLILILCNFLLFIFQLKLCLYTTMHVLLGEFNNLFQVTLTQ